MVAGYEPGTFEELSSVEVDHNGLLVCVVTIHTTQQLLEAELRGSRYQYPDMCTTSAPKEVTLFERCLEA
jgi:hypothetical protein